ncbi:MAG: phosphoribosylformylglycinamidine synthase, partial [Lawsonibacter sp.]|nr:phosphoribosylformylglycinamidine synthase [Lawsonibacter sp.]
LLGGRTGRDGIGGATGSSKSHNKKSLTTMASEVQKGNAPEERKIQRLFRDGEVTRLIKRCNDFGAGGVSVAIGELADGLEIDLDAVRKKYDGLDGTELAISESQERMAVVVAPEDADKFIAAAEKENLEAYQVAVVTESPRMVMHWKGQKIADLSRAFLNTNGAVKHAAACVPLAQEAEEEPDYTVNLRKTASSLKCASRRGLTERFDGSIGAGSVLMPFGGKTQSTPAQVMAALLPVLPGQETDQASVMAWGCDPEALSANPYRGAYEAVTASIAKLVAAGADYKKVYLTLQEFFEKLRDEPLRWGKPAAALLGALDAQLDYGCAAIGGKDSMSGSFLDKDVPPTLISFAIAPIKAGEVMTPEFKEAGHAVYLFYGGDTAEEQRTAWEEFEVFREKGEVKAAWAVENRLEEAVMKMSFGNRIGFTLSGGGKLWSKPLPGAIVAELTVDLGNEWHWFKIGETTADPVIDLGNGDSAAIDELLKLNEGVLEEVYPTRAGKSETVQTISWDKRSPAVCKNKTAHPKAVIPVFPGTNCEYDTAKACVRAGIDPEIVVVRNLSTDLLAQSAQALEGAIRGAQMVVLPGGFSGGDEPEGSGKFIASFLRNPALSDAIMDLLKHRDGLMLGICNGFQALVKLGLVPFGEIRPMDGNCPTLTYNLIGRHQSRYVTTRVASVQSPWMLKCNVGDLHTIPISHGEGRFVAPAEVISSLIASGQVGTQYVDASGQPTMDILSNPNGSMEAIEGIFSPDGRVFGKMGHLERRGPFVAVNIPGEKHMPLFESGAEYFK